MFAVSDEWAQQVSRCADRFLPGSVGAAGKTHTGQMSKPFKPRFQQSSLKKKPKIFTDSHRIKYATKLQVGFARRLLQSNGLSRPGDSQNLQAMSRSQISSIIESCLEKKRKRQAQGNKPSPLPNRSRDNALSTPGQSQGETPKELAGLTLQP